MDNEWVKRRGWLGPIRKNPIVKPILKTACLIENE